MNPLVFALLSLTDVSGPGPSQATPLVGQTLTLDEALGLSETHAFSIQSAWALNKKASDQVSGAYSLLGPKLTLSGTASTSDTEFNFGSAAGTSSAAFGPTGWQNYNFYTLSLSQNIDLNGLAHRGIQELKSQRSATEEGIRTSVNSVRSAVKSKFLTLLQQVELEKVQEENLQAATGRVKRAQVQLDAGAIPRFDVLTLETQEKQAERDLVTAQGGVLLARDDLNDTIGIPIETEYQAVPYGLSPELKDTPDELVRAGLKNRPEVRQQRDTVDALDANEEIQSAGYRPSLALSASRTNYIAAPIGSTTSATNVGLTLTVPLWDSGQAESNVRAARSDTESARIQLRQIELSVAYDVRTSYTNAMTALKGKELAAKNVELAQESLRIAQLRYDERAGILLDVINAQANLVSAEAAAVNADSQYLQAYAGLQRAVGADDLKAHDKPSALPTPPQNHK